MRRIDVVTVGRSDWGIYLPVVRLLAERADVNLRILASGSHLRADQGWTVLDAERAGFGIVERIEMLLASDAPEAIAKSIALGVSSFAQAFSTRRPDLVVVLGDRFEMFAAATATVPLLLPLAHLHGGERTGGAIDDVFRHAMTKMSHLHFASTVEYGRRLRQLGEEPWRITVSGAPAVDGFLTTPLLSASEIMCEFGIDVERPFVICTYHPTTLAAIDDAALFDSVLESLERHHLPVIFTMPNVDTGGAALRKRVADSCARLAHRGWRAFSSLGPRGYASVLARATAVVGNSSSALIEAPHFGVPAVNVGMRQQGRVRGQNVLDAPDAGSVDAAVARALDADFRSALKGAPNPYGDGRASDRIVDVLTGVPLDDRLMRKGFVDIGGIEA